MFIPHNPEKLLDILRDFTVIVEGKKDVRALRGLGVFDILDISGQSLENFTKKLNEDKKYVVLTDFDREGERKSRDIVNFLEKHKFKFSKKVRLLIKNSFGFTKVEELIKFSKLKEDVYYGKVSTINYKIFNRSRFYRKWCSRETRRNWGDIWSDRGSSGPGT